jgi:DNA-binding protein HU-beta
MRSKRRKVLFIERSRMNYAIHHPNPTFSGLALCGHLRRSRRPERRRCDAGKLLDGVKQRRAKPAIRPSLPRRLNRNRHCL